MIKEYIDKITDELDLHSSYQEQDKSYSLEINPQILVKIFDRSPGIFFFAKIGLLFYRNREEFLMHSMEGNFLGRGTGSSVLALDENKEYLTLSLNIPYEITYKGFHEQLEDFVNYVSFWQDEIKTFEEKAKQSPLT